MKMSRELFECLECNGVSVRDDYSGRCMYGEECFGYVDDDLSKSYYNLTNAFQDIIENVDDELLVQEAEDLLETVEYQNSRSDNMGLSYIIYFPDIQVEKS